MASILMWIGVILTVIGWLALAWQASKRMEREDELEKFPQKRKTMQMYRNYCWLTIGAGMLLLIIAIFI